MTSNLLAKSRLFCLNDVDMVSICTDKEAAHIESNGICAAVRAEGKKNYELGTPYALQRQKLF